MANSSHAILHEKLQTLIQTLKNNREKVPLDDLKTIYQTGYNNLLSKIAQTASEYAKMIVLSNTFIHRDYIDLIVPIVKHTLLKSGILKQMSKSIFINYSIDEFNYLALLLRKAVQTNLNLFYLTHSGLYITNECLNNPAKNPEIYCFLNDSILQNQKWIPLTKFVETK